MKYAICILICLLTASVVRAEDLSAQAYCDYDKQKTEAERMLDQPPSLLVGFGRNNSATSNVMAIGVTESLSKFLQGNLSGKIGDADCRLYHITTEIQKHVMFDMQSLQLEQAQKRLDLIEDGLKRIDALIGNEKSRLGVGSSTLQNVAILDAAKQTLLIMKAQIAQQVALTVLPGVDDERLDGLLKLANLYTLNEQQLMAKQSKLQSWDLSVTVGEGTNPNYELLHKFPNETFATAQFTYSFGASRRAKALDKAAESYTTAVMTSATNPVTLANLIRTQVTRARDAATASLEGYRIYSQSIQNQVETVKDVDGSVARAFRIQLEISQVENDIELNANQYVSKSMGAYLDRNFGEN